VRYVLEGSVRKSGRRVRVTMQLIGADTNHHIMAERYDRDLTDLFELQDEHGSSSNKLGSLGKFIGVAPSAGRLYRDVTCPATSDRPPPYAICANLPAGNGNGQAPIPAVPAFYAIATDGETYFSAPIVPEGIPPVCPSMPPGKTGHPLRGYQRFVPCAGARQRRLACVSRTKEPFGCNDDSREGCLRGTRRRACISS
jgi:hypothetical protein